MITPEPKPAMPGSETCVPQAALEQNGETPEPGAEFEFSGKGRVTRVEGGHVYFETTQVNGEPVAAPEKTEPNEEDVMRAAEEADRAAE